MTRPPASSPRALRLGLAGALAIAAPLSGHDFWLVPLGFRVAPGAELVVLGQTSSAFPSSESAVTPDRVAEARLVNAAGETAVTDYAPAGISLRLRHRPATPGQRIVAVRLHPRSVRESAEGFRRYLTLEGAPEALARLEREGRMPTDSVTRRYAKYAKAVVELGDGGPRAWSRTVGHPLEFVPLGDPAALRPGDTLSVRLLHHGHPAAGARLHAGMVPLPADAELNRLGGAERHHEVVTDGAGVARIPIGDAGLWNLRALQIEEAARGSGADWETHWATLVFAVETGAPAGQDSAAVLAAVERFHAALADGDSAAVAGLLAPEAVILESGGIETREQYLGGHLRGDIAFARAVPRQRGPMTVRVAGAVAWASSTSVAQGTYREREINSTTAELMVLVRGEGRWRIAAVHWSSRARRP